MIIGYIKGQELEIIQNTIVSDSIDYLTAEFNFSTNEWDGFIKWAHFKKDDIVYDVLLADDKILKSQHLNLSAGVWEVYVHGNKSGGTERITTNIVKLTVEPTGALNGEPLPEIPLEVSEQIMATIGSLDNLETTEKTNIVAAINEAVKTGRILNIEQTKTSSEDKGENEITISLADGKNFSFTFYNGSKGSKGDKGDPGTGGAFYITLTEDSGGNYTANKTFDEIKAAYAENKEIIVYGDDIFCRLVSVYPSPDDIRIMGFSATDEGRVVLIACNESNWKVIVYENVTTKSVVQEISESSRPDKVPSAKAVYTAIQAEKGTANGVATLDTNAKIPLTQIPDDIARTSQIPSPVQSDYNQNNDTQPDYIKNRTHYKEIIHQERVDLLSATEIGNSSAGEVLYSQPEPLNIQVGDTVKVLWDNQEYECVAQSFTTLDPDGRTGFPADCIAFGNFYYAFEVDPDSQNFPFLVIANYALSEQEGFISGCFIMPTIELTNLITVNIFTGGDKVVYHKLDVNYLNLSSSVSQNDNNPVTGDAVYDAIQNADNRVIATLYLDSEGNDAVDKTFEELKKAYEANKEIVIQLSNLIIPCVGTSWDSNGNITAIYFQKALKWPYPLIMTYKVTASGLTSKEDKLVSGSKSSTINNSSTNEEFPTAKAVYTAIQAEKGKAEGVATLDTNAKIPLTQIPDDIARTSQIPSLDGYITETELENKGYLTDETDPTVPDWAKQTTKPTYTADEVGAESKGVAETKVSTHNTETTSHNDIRLAIQNLSEKLNALADSDDTTLDQLSEIVAYIKNNKSLIDNVTTSKVSIADIINNLTTNVSNKPLSAAQGVALKALIDDITIPSSLPANGGNADTVDGKHASDFAMSSHTHTASEVSGLAKVATSGSYSDLSGTPTIDKTLSETSTDENVPSSKCVYEAIQSAIGTALGGSY